MCPEFPPGLPVYSLTAHSIFSDATRNPFIKSPVAPCPVPVLCSLSVPARIPFRKPAYFPCEVRLPSVRPVKEHSRLLPENLPPQTIRGAYFPHPPCRYQPSILLAEKIHSLPVQDVSEGKQKINNLKLKRYDFQRIYGRERLRVADNLLE